MTAAIEVPVIACELKKRGGRGFDVAIIVGRVFCLLAPVVVAADGDFYSDRTGGSALKMSAGTGE